MNASFDFSCFSFDKHSPENEVGKFEELLLLLLLLLLATDAPVLVGGKDGADEDAEDEELAREFVAKLATWCWVFSVNFRIFFGISVESLIKFIICLLEDDDDDDEAAADDEVGAKLNIWWWWWIESLLFDKLTVFIWVWLLNDEIKVAGIGSEISLDTDASWWLLLNSLKLN